MMTSFPPGLMLILAGLLLPFLHGTSRSIALLFFPALTLALIWFLPDDALLQLPFLQYELTLLQVDNLSRLFALVFALMALAGGAFALKQKNTFELAAAFVYAGGAISVTFSGDLISLFIFWEIMAIASTLVVLCGGPSAHNAALRYAAIHFLGGVLLMAGIAGEISASGNIALTQLSNGEFTFSRYLLLAGLLINAGAPPLSAWLPDSYPKASWTGMIFLSAFTTKTAVYVLMRTFPGTEILLYLGLFMVFYGIIYAILENDMRRLLAYSIISQVGFMVCAVGIGSDKALNGVAAHAFAHIIYKALLLMSAGSVIYMTGKSKFTELGGLFRSMPVTTFCAIVGALSIAAFPLTSGFVSKTIIAKAAADEHLMLVWFMLEAASAGTCFYVGFKFPWFVFFHKDAGLRPVDPPINMQISMIFMAVACILIGLFPSALYAMLPFSIDYVPYTGAHIVFQAQLMIFAGLAFFLMLVWVGKTNTITLDFDWVYRKIGFQWVLNFNDFLTVTWRQIVAGFSGGVQKVVAKIYRYSGPDGLLARPWETGVMAFWTTFLLAAYLLIYYYIK
ncbi:MAG: Na(+)/H(+) antiporter subunit D [Pseudomonadota bacterium]